MNRATEKGSLVKGDNFLPRINREKVYQKLKINLQLIVYLCSIIFKTNIAKWYVLSIFHAFVIIEHFH